MGKDQNFFHDNFAYMLDCLHATPHEISEHYEKFQHVVKLAKILGTRYIRMISFYHNGGSEWTAEERENMPPRLKVFGDGILCFVAVGLDRTMNAFNKK